MKLEVLRWVVFGERAESVANISYSIERAFEVHRQRLLGIMEHMGSIVSQLEHTDSAYDRLFQPVHARILNFANVLPEYWERNEFVLRDLIQPGQVPFTFGIMPPAAAASAVLDGEQEVLPSPPETFSTDGDKQPDVASYNSLVQVLVHLSRDWSADGSRVRRQLYQDGVLRYIRKYLPAVGPSGGQPQVLVPGAGLGRLAVDLAQQGYRVEANECSAAMLCAMHTVLDKLLLTGQTRTIYPALHYAMTDDWDLSNKLHTVTFPDIQDSESAWTAEEMAEKLPSLLSLQFGDFVGVYGASNSVHDQRFDAVVTCYFMDTGRSIIEYIEVIKRVLRPGGLWINTGPLHYHHPGAVPYSYRDVLSIIELMGFDLLQEERIMMSYAGEEEVSMKPEIYHTPIAAFTKRRTALEKDKEDSIETAVPPPMASQPFRRPDYVVVMR